MASEASPSNPIKGNELAVAGSASGAVLVTAISAGGGLWTTWAISTSSPVGRIATTGICFSVATTSGSAGLATSN